MHPARTMTAVALALAVFLAGPVAAQCILSNPSFEVTGSGSQVFGGWEQFGSVGLSSTASHGSKAARVSGPNTGSWDVSGYWQSQDCAEGEQWQATGHVLNPSARPLVGQNAALVNIEWRDDAGGLITYDTFNVAVATSPTDEYLDFSVTSTPAPAGTVSARLLLGVLQSPTDPVSDVIFDQVTFTSTTFPTLDDIQWLDFPGGRTLTFAGRTWRVKGPGTYDPGLNVFSDAVNNVWVDEDDQLHLTLKNVGGTWNSTEVVAEEALGYGDYILTTVGRLDLIDPQAVLGIFLWQFGPCWDSSYLWWNPYNEIDIEYSRWQDPGNTIAQFVAQPYDWPGNLDRFDAVFSAGETVSHAMRWMPDKVEYRVWRGGPSDESSANLIAAWTYTGPHIPRPEQPRMHLNLWRIAGSPAANQEVVFRDFTFVPAGGASGVAEGPARSQPGVPGGWLYPAVPNPFNPRTELRFALAHDGFAALQIYDLSGRVIRTLASENFVAGAHSRTWDGRDDGDLPVASGVYFYRLSGRDFQETRRIVLLK